MEPALIEQWMLLWNWVLFQARKALAPPHLATGRNAARVSVKSKKKKKALEGVNPKKIIQKKKWVHFYLHRKLSFPAWPQGWEEWSHLVINGLILSTIRSWSTLSCSKYDYQWNLRATWTSLHRGAIPLISKIRGKRLLQTPGLWFSASPAPVPSSRFF